MGTETAEILIDVATAERIRRGTRAGAFAADMAHEAIMQWEPERRSASARVKNPAVAPAQSWVTARGFIDNGRVPGQCVVFPVAHPDDVEVTTVKVKVPVTAKQLSSINAGHVLSMEILDSLRAEHGYTFVSAKAVKAPASLKPKARATDGAITTVYDVVCQGWNRDVTVATKPTLAAARAEAISIMEDDPEIPALAVRGRITRVADTYQSTPDLVTIERPAPARAQVTVEVTLHTAKAGARVTEYIVAFDYHV